MKKFKMGTMLILIVGLLLIFPQLAFADDSYTLFIDGKQINTNGVIYDNTLYYSIADVAKSIGRTVTWDNITKSILIKKDSNEIIMTINNNILLNNGKEIIMKHPPLIINNRSFAPISYIVNYFGYNVIVSSNKTCSVTMKPEIKEFININNEFNSLIIKMDKLIAQNTISESELNTMKTEVNTICIKIQSWGELLEYHSIKNLYYKTLKDGLSTCFYKSNIDNPEFNLIIENNKKSYESYNQKYNFDKIEIKAELTRLQKSNYL